MKSGRLSTVGNDSDKVVIAVQFCSARLLWGFNVKGYVFGKKKLTPEEVAKIQKDAEELAGISDTGKWMLRWMAEHRTFINLLNHVAAIDAEIAGLASRNEQVANDLRDISRILGDKQLLLEDRIALSQKLITLTLKQISKEEPTT